MNSKSETGVKFFFFPNLRSCAIEPFVSEGAKRKHKEHINPAGVGGVTNVK